MLKFFLKKNKLIYFKLSLLNKITLPQYFLNIIFKNIFRKNSKARMNIHFTSTMIQGKKIEYSNDINTLSSFAVSGSCYFQAINGIQIGKNFLFAPGINLISANHHFDNLSLSKKANPIIIGDNVWVGANVTILPEVRIGSNCVIGAGSIVTKSFIEDNLIIAGNPAKIIRKK